MEEVHDAASAVEDEYERLQHYEWLQQQHTDNSNYDGESYLNPTGPGEILPSVYHSAPPRSAAHESASESQLYVEIIWILVHLSPLQSCLDNNLCNTEQKFSVIAEGFLLQQYQICPNTIGLIKS